MEKDELDNLEDELLSVRNMVDLTLLAVHMGKYDLIPTGIEETYYKMQMLVDDYCIIENLPSH